MAQGLGPRISLIVGAFGAPWAHGAHRALWPQTFKFHKKLWPTRLGFLTLFFGC